MLTSEQRRAVIRRMKSERPIAWPAEDELVREFVSTSKEMFSVTVPENEARAAVAQGRFKD